MTLKKATARAGRNPYPARAASDKPSANSPRRGPGVKSLASEWALDCAATLLEKSRLCAEAVLSAGLIDPIALNDAAYAAGVSGRDFIEPSHSALFTFCCLNAEAGRKPRIPEFVPLARAFGLDVDQGDFALQFRHASNPRELPSLLESLKQFSKMRERVVAISQELRGLGVTLDELPVYGGEIELTPDCLAGWTPKVKVVSRRVPPRWRKRAAQR